MVGGGEEFKKNWNLGVEEEDKRKVDDRDESSPVNDRREFKEFLTIGGTMSCTTSTSGRSCRCRWAR